MADELDEAHRVQLSKFLSGVLRHFPDEVGLELDPRGWADLDALIEAARDRYGWARADHVRAVIATDPKGRFQVEDGRVRAVYGHSVDVRVDEDRGPVPDRLYHGTARANLEAIREEGLRGMQRREVHLSDDRATARAVGARHADDVVVLAVDVEGLRAEGIEVQRRADDVYTCKRVPPEHLHVPDEPT